MNDYSCLHRGVRARQGCRGSGGVRRSSGPAGPAGPAGQAGATLAGALAGAVGGDVLAVAAVAGVAVTAGAVAGQVDEHGVAVGGVADAEAFGLAQADQVGEGEAGLGPDAVGQRGRGLGDVQVPAPAAAVVDDPGAVVGCAQQAVDQGGQVGGAAGRGPDRAQARAQGLQCGQAGQVVRSPAGAVGVQEGLEGGGVRQQVLAVAQGVDQVGGQGEGGHGVMGEHGGTSSDLGGQALGGDQPVAVPEQLGQLGPVVVAIEQNPDPAL